MLTVEQEKMISNLVVSNVRDQSVIGEFDFDVKHNECSDEEIDALNTVCTDPSGKMIYIPDGIWVSVKYSVTTDSYEIFGLWHM